MKVEAAVPVVELPQESTGFPPPPLPERDQELPNTVAGASAAGSAAAVFKAGLIGVLLGMIPFLGSVLTGMLAVWFYRRAGGGSVSGSRGAKLGSAGAAVAFAISALYVVLQVFVFHAQVASEEAMTKLMEALGFNLSDPEVQASIHRLFTPSGLASSIVLTLIVSVLLGAFGGLVAAVSRPRRRL